MRNRKNGILKTKWSDFEFETEIGTLTMNQFIFEKSYGKFVAMLFANDAVNAPYAVWSEDKVLLVLKDYPLGLASVNRNPSVGQFG